jgi:hypothetical protein
MFKHNSHAGCAFLCIAVGQASLICMRSLHAFAVLRAGVGCLCMLFCERAAAFSMLTVSLCVLQHDSVANASRHANAVTVAVSWLVSRCMAGYGIKSNIS